MSTIIKIKTGRESGVAIEDDKSLRSYLNDNDFTVENPTYNIGSKIINNLGAIIGYLYTPSFCNLTLEGNYKWVILWVWFKLLLLVLSNLTNCGNITLVRDLFDSSFD